jgi:hypothetical protein
VGYRQLRVYCGPREGHGLFVYSRVFATKREMLQALRVEAHQIGERGFGRHTGATMQTFKQISYHGQKPRTQAAIGRVSFYRRRLTDEIVTHEFAHAMFAYGERKGLTRQWLSSDSTMLTEELYCYALGRMVARFWRRAKAMGFRQGR